jgi:tetratricopeptide (TPR) repeat protein
MTEEPITATVPAASQEAAEKMLRDAHIHRMRGQWAVAEDLVRKALELAPDDAQGREMLGDLFVEKDKLEEALAEYRRAQEIQPDRGLLEEKIARAVLRKDEEERERIAAQLLIDSPKGQQHRRRAANIAVLMSLLCPGAGQFFNGQAVKAGVILGCWGLGLFFGAGDLITFVLGLAGALRKHAEQPDGFRAMLGAIAVIIWIYGMLDAASQAGKGKRLEL